MVKVASRDILDILRRYELAGDDNVPRNVENIYISHTTTTNTLVQFIFNKKLYFLLFDDTAADDVSLILPQIKTSQGVIKGDLLLNPRDENQSYAMPFRSKDCYLFQAGNNKQRLDAYLAHNYPNISRSTWQKFIKNGTVRVNSQSKTSVKYEISNSDIIDFDTPSEPDYSDKKLPIIYLDDDVIVVDKPAGVLSHSKGSINNEFTVADFFKKYSTYNANTNRPGIVHRLDRDTSGVIVGARNQKSAEFLQKQFSQHKVEKIYYAVLDGCPKLKTANIDLPIARSPSAPSTFRVDPKGKQSTTYYEVISENGHYSLVKLMPNTGRTHQLRVHMAYLNTPILGDRIYGHESDRLYLHANTVQIILLNGKKHIFESKLPDSFTSKFPKLREL